VAYPISIATDNETATIRVARVIFLVLLGFVASDSMNFFDDVGFDDVNIYFSPPFILMSSFEVVDGTDPSAIIHR
jgi:hypothetical protein